VGIVSLALLGLIWRANVRGGSPSGERESIAAGAQSSRSRRVEVAKPTITPPAMLAGEKLFSVQPVSFVDAKPDGFAPAGPIYKFGPSGRTFPEPVTITVPYDPRRTSKGAVLALWTRGDGDSKWSRVEGAIVDRNRQVLVAKVSHFSLFSSGQDCTDLDGDGLTPCNGDCDETNAQIHAGATEICGDRVDQNCNGILDEGCPSEW
jgi:hypothetical protein